MYWEINFVADSLKWNKRYTTKDCFTNSHDIISKSIYFNLSSCFTVYMHNKNMKETNQSMR